MRLAHQLRQLLCSLNILGQRSTHEHAQERLAGVHLGCGRFHLPAGRLALKSLALYLGFKERLQEDLILRVLEHVPVASKLLRHPLQPVDQSIAVGCPNAVAHRRVARRQARDIAEAGRGHHSHVVPGGTRTQHREEGSRHHQWQVAYGAGVDVVLFRIDKKGLRAGKPYEPKDRLHGCVGSIDGGADAVRLPSKQRGLGRRDAGRFFASHRMAADEVNVFGQRLLCPTHNVGLGARCVGDDRPLSEIRSHLLHYLAHAKNGNGNDNHTRSGDSSGQVVLRAIDRSALLRLRRVTPIPIVAYDLEAW